MFTQKLCNRRRKTFVDTVPVCRTFKSSSAGVSMMILGIKGAKALFPGSDSPAVLVGSLIGVGEGFDGVPLAKPEQLRVISEHDRQHLCLFLVRFADRTTPNNQAYV
jgi:hypothetical protein